jgi:hypothetical protein
VTAATRNENNMLISLVSWLNQGNFPALPAGMANR